MSNSTNLGLKTKRWRRIYLIKRKQEKDILKENRFEVEEEEQGKQEAKLKVEGKDEVEE